MINLIGWIGNSLLNTLSQPSLIGICHTIGMHVTLISKATVAKKTIGKNQKEKEENLIAQKEKEEINPGGKPRDLRFTMKKIV